jgi:aryl-alcohol dehydrogenase-like predicted oxidoreductase
MTPTNLGDSGLPVSRLGLGLAALGRPGYINLGHSADLGGNLDVESMEASAAEVLDFARSRGVRYFDAARSYGRAEAFLASWLKSRIIKPGELTIGSKWGYTYTAGWKVEADRHEVKDHALATLRRQAGETFETLDGSVSLYQIHSATLESGVLDNRSVLEELARLRAESGWKIGLSTTGPRQAETIRKALGIEVDGIRLFDSVQATWNLLEPSSDHALAEARSRGVGVIVKEALANGRLTDRNNDPAFAPRKALLEAEAARLGTTLDALALAAALAQPWADVVLSGASTSEQLGSNLKAETVPWDDQAEVALQAIAEPSEEYWTTRARLSWN